VTEREEETRIQTLAAPMYALLYAELRLIARGHGYALAIHGSMKRDLDLVAIPWITKCSSATMLADAFQIYIGNVNNYEEKGAKPHGRATFIFHLDEKNYGDGAYIDLSVIPMITNE
jgi:hypothetical protein